MTLLFLLELMQLSAEVSDDLTLIAEQKKEDTNNEEMFQNRQGQRSPSQIMASLWKEADNFSKFHAQAVSVLIDLCVVYLFT